MLGCGTWDAYITERGGVTRILWIPYSQLSCNRRLDDTSSAGVTVPLGAAQASGCCEPLSSIASWEHELVLERDGNVVWAGPVVGVTYGLTEVTISANDLFYWMDRRLLEDAFDITNDLALIFDFVVSQALSRDTSPNFSIVPSSTGVDGRRVNDRSGVQRAGDLLRELARTSLDFTAVGRSILVGGVSFDLDPIILTTESFATNLTLKFDGTSQASEITVQGASADLVERAGGIGSETGLVQIVEQESSIFDSGSLAVAAEGRLDVLSEPASAVDGTLTARADVQFSQLIPGVECDMRLELACREFISNMRLASVSVTVNAQGEQVGVSFIPVGAS